MTLLLRSNEHTPAKIIEQDAERDGLINYLNNLLYSDSDMIVEVYIHPNPLTVSAKQRREMILREF